MWIHVGNSYKPNNDNATTGGQGCNTIPCVGAGEGYDPKNPKTWKNYNNVIKGVDQGDKGYLFTIRGSEAVESIKELGDQWKQMTDLIEKSTSKEKQ